VRGWAERGLAAGQRREFPDLDDIAGRGRTARRLVAAGDAGQEGAGDNQPRPDDLCAPKFHKNSGLRVMSSNPDRVSIYPGAFNSLKRILADGPPMHCRPTPSPRLSGERAG